MRNATFTQSFNISEMAKELGMIAGQKIDKRIVLKGECFFTCKCAYMDCRITRARITEAKDYRGQERTHNP